MLGSKYRLSREAVLQETGPAGVKCLIAEIAFELWMKHLSKCDSCCKMFQLILARRGVPLDGREN